MDIRDDEKGMTLIVKTVTRLTLGFILLYGIYISLSGHMSPGGGFAGGVIVALSFVHLMLAFGKDVALKRFSSGALRIAISISALIFLYIVVAGSSPYSLPLCS
jgi:multicomponent Na+:H+ antiporter subunit B